jgi:hypothetical protein
MDVALARRGTEEEQIESGRLTGAVDADERRAWLPAALV